VCQLQGDKRCHCEAAGKQLWTPSEAHAWVTSDLSREPLTPGTSSRSRCFTPSAAEAGHPPPYQPATSPPPSMRAVDCGEIRSPDLPPPSADCTLCAKKGLLRNRPTESIYYHKNHNQIASLEVVWRSCELRDLELQLESSKFQSGNGSEVAAVR